ncbi:glutathione S-transferase N-terminal domain-containing protein [Roseibium sp.]|uniref:glutathione S-transferase N-terminal domain-containing protein n=1 Tax=Roseibium sp. TaxID=1936156 RepID=UPI003A96CC46
MNVNTLQSAEAAVPPAPRLLRSTLTSPFGRKVRMAMVILGLGDQIEVEPADTRSETDTLREQNPLGKMPCLLLDSGTAIYDSRVIIEFLDQWSGRNRLIPQDAHDRAQVLTCATLADGIADAALLMVYEGRFRDPEQKSEVWLSHQRGKVERGLTAISHALPNPKTTDIASISLACALGYLDWREPVEWRSRFPKLVEWLKAFAAAEPAFDATRRPDEAAS